MAKPYSNDLRARVIAAVEEGRDAGGSWGATSRQSEFGRTVPSTQAPNRQRQSSEIRRVQTVCAGRARGVGQAVGDGAAGYHTGGASRQTDEAEGHGWPDLDLS